MSGGRSAKSNAKTIFTIPDTVRWIIVTAMTSIAYQRCFNHAHREAVAVCPECNRFFCRECVTEHEDRILCAVCLNALLKPERPGRSRFSGPMKLIQFMLGFFTIWLCFYYLGKVLLAIPSSFHEGTLWKLW